MDMEGAIESNSSVYVSLIVSITFKLHIPVCTSTLVQVFRKCKSFEMSRWQNCNSYCKNYGIHVFIDLRKYIWQVYLNTMTALSVLTAGGFTPGWDVLSLPYLVCSSHVFTHAFTSCLVERASCRRRFPRDAAMAFHGRQSSIKRVQSVAHGVLVASKWELSRAARRAVPPPVLIAGSFNSKSFWVRVRSAGPLSVFFSLKGPGVRIKNPRNPLRGKKFASKLNPRDPGVFRRGKDLVSFHL